MEYSGRLLVRPNGIGFTIVLVRIGEPVRTFVEAPTVVGGCVELRLFGGGWAPCE